MQFFYKKLIQLLRKKYYQRNFADVTKVFCRIFVIELYYLEFLKHLSIDIEGLVPVKKTLILKLFVLFDFEYFIYSKFI